jgi:hypothetical protein
VLSQKSTKMNYRVLLFFVSFSLLAVACEKTDDDQPTVDPNAVPSFVFEDPVLGCGTYETIVPALEEGQALFHVVPFGDHLALGTSDQLVVVDKSGAVLFQQELSVQQLTPYQSSVFVCADEGIYELNEDLDLTSRTAVSCNDLKVTGMNQVIFASGDTPDFFNRINELVLGPDTVAAFSDSYIIPGCPGLEKLTLVGQDEVWAVDCDGRVAQFMDGEYITTFDSGNTPLLPGISFADQTFVVTYEEDVAVVAKNASSFYQLMKFKGADWELLKQIVFNTPGSEVDTYMLLSSITDVAVVGNFLYVTTTLAGCRGIHRFLIERDESLFPDQIRVIQDPNLPGQCVDRMYVAPNDDVYIITNQREVTIIKC